MTTEDELDEAGLRLVKRLNRLMFKVDVVSIADLGRITVQKQKSQLRFAEVRWRQKLENTI